MNAARSGFRRRSVAGVAVAATILGVLAAELLVRWFAPQSPPDMFTADPKTGFRLTANYRGEDVSGTAPIPLAFNSWGLRDRELETIHTARLRMYVLGDSFVFGHGVAAEDTFAKVLERALRTRPGFADVEVINGGVPRYGTLQEVELFGETVDLVKPDLVLLGVYVGNDVLDNVDFAERRTGAGRSGLVEWMRVRSQLYMWLRRQRHAAGDRMNHLQHAAMRTHATRPTADVVRGLEMTEDAIASLARDVAGRGMQFGIVLIPSADQVHAERWRAVLGRYALSAAEYDPAEPNRRFVRFGAEQGIPVLDLLPVLQARQDEELYFALHWNPRGHALSAQAAAEFVVREYAAQAKPSEMN